MSDTDDLDICFPVKFLGRVEVVRPEGLQVLEEALDSLKEVKKSKVQVFVSQSGIDILENKTKAAVLVSVIGDVFRVPQEEAGLRGGRDLMVEALRMKNKVLQKENTELRRRLQHQTQEN